MPQISLDSLPYWCCDDMHVYILPVMKFPNMFMKWKLVLQLHLIDFSVCTLACMVICSVIWIRERDLNQFQILKDSTFFWSILFMVWRVLFLPGTTWSRCSGWFRFMSLGGVTGVLSECDMSRSRPAHLLPPIGDYKYYAFVALHWGEADLSGSRDMGAVAISCCLTTPVCKYPGQVSSSSLILLEMIFE